MENSKNYHDEQNNINTMRMREVLDTLPPFCKQFFRGIQEYTSSRTRLAYAYDIRVFFVFAKLLRVFFICYLIFSAFFTIDLKATTF